MSKFVTIPVVLTITIMNAAGGGRTLPDVSCRVVGSAETCAILPSPNIEVSGQQMLKFSSSEDRWNGYTRYTNISVDIPARQIGVLLVHGRGPAKIDRIAIDLRRIPTSQFRVSVEFLPFRADEVGVSWMPTNTASYIANDPCSDQHQLHQCNLLMRSSLITKTIRNSIEVFLAGDWKEALTVEVVGRSCNSSCDELRPSCSPNITTMQWNDPSVPLRISNLVPANYCARIVFRNNGSDCCSIFTGSAIIQHLQWIPHTPNRYYITKFFYLMCAVALLIVALTLMIHYRFKKGQQRDFLPKKTVRKSEDQTQLTSFRELDPSEIEILLVYPKQDKLFMSTMKVFRKLLRQYVKKVWDPLEQKEIEHVSENPAMWRHNVLAIPDVKIVLVETEEAVAWYHKDNRILDIEDDDMYLSVISYIHNHPELIFNYRRVQVVRFLTMKSTTDQLNIVPQKRFQMPHQLGLLIMDITGRQDYTNDGSEASFPDLERFCTLTEEYQAARKKDNEYFITL